MNCCGGSLSTLGNMKRPVAARHPADAAVNAPHARPIQPRLDINGEVSSAAPARFAAGAVTLREAAAALVVLPARPAPGVGAGGTLGSSAMALASA